MTSVSPTPSESNSDTPRSAPPPPASEAVTPAPAEPDVIDLRASRLAELVAGLTGCERTGALHAIRSSADRRPADALELVARAMVDVDQPPPEGFRVAGFLRDDLPGADDGSLDWDRGEDDDGTS